MKKKLNDVLRIIFITVWKYFIKETQAQEAEVFSKISRSKNIDEISNSYSVFLYIPSS